VQMHNADVTPEITRRTGHERRKQEIQTPVARSSTAFSLSLSFSPSIRGRTDKPDGYLPEVARRSRGTNATSERAPEERRGGAHTLESEATRA